jgi:hypothetical protein
MFRVGEDWFVSAVGLVLLVPFAPFVLSSKTIDGMRKLLSAPALRSAICTAESGIAVWKCDKEMP